uniref:Ubiquitin-conjugating enzyme E2Q family member 2 n=1 Tax=Salmo trutta TaxID=8032 RepID=A0A674DYS1_SALTR
HRASDKHDEFGISQESYPSTPPIWFVDSDDPSLTEVLERLEYVRKGTSLLLQQLKRLICDLCRLYNLPQHPDVEMLDQPLPAGPINPERKHGPADEVTSEEEEEEEMGEDIEDLDHYEMKEEEPVHGKKSEDDGIEKENLAILEKIRKNQRQDHLNVSAHSVRRLSYFSWGGNGNISTVFIVSCLALRYPGSDPCCDACFRVPFLVQFRRLIVS